MNGQGYQAPFHSVWSVLFLEEAGGYINVNSVKIHGHTLTIGGFLFAHYAPIKFILTNVNHKAFKNK